MCLGAQFVRALAAISNDELKDARAPRAFSLTKIVEVAHFNMGRIRLVWSRIWSVLSEYFIAVGCHPNLSLAKVRRGAGGACSACAAGGRGGVLLAVCAFG